MGLWVGLMPLMYTPVRFFLDYLRATDVSAPDVRYAGLTPAQYASVLMFVLSIIWLVRVFKKPEWTMPEEMRLSFRAKSGGRTNGDDTKSGTKPAKTDAKSGAKDDDGAESGADGKSKSGSAKKSGSGKRRKVKKR